MTRRRLPLLLAAAGLIVILASVIAAVVVRAADTATLSLGERPDVPVVVTEPGVLDAVDSEVTIRATAGEDEQVVLAVGRTSEVDAWLGTAEHGRITGLSSWEELTVEIVTGAEPAPEPTDAATEAPTGQPADDATEGGVPNPAGSDLWLAESVGTGSTELSWSDSPGRWSLVAATDGTGPAPELELEWGRQVSTPWLVPGIVVGALALVAGLTLLVLDVLARREQRRRDDARARRAAGEGGMELSVTDTDPGTGERLTRRQIREMERRMAEVDRRRRQGEPVEPPVPLAPGWAEQGDALPADAEHDDAADDRAAHAAPATATDTAADDDRDDPAAQVAAAEGSPLEDPAPADRDEPAADVEPPGAETGAAGHHEPYATGVAAAGTEPAEEPAAREPDDDEPPATPSWRSVWGFGGRPIPPSAPPGPSTSDTATEDTDGEEQR